MMPNLTLCQTLPLTLALRSLKPHECAHLTSLNRRSFSLASTYHRPFVPILAVQIP